MGSPLDCMIFVCLNWARSRERNSPTSSPTSTKTVSTLTAHSLMHSLRLRKTKLNFIQHSSVTTTDNLIVCDVYKGSKKMMSIRLVSIPHVKQWIIDRNRRVEGLFDKVPQKSAHKSCQTTNQPILFPKNSPTQNSLPLMKLTLIYNHSMN